MTRGVGILTCVLLAGCLGPVGEGGLDGGSTQLQVRSGCGSDADCPGGMVCEGCGTGDGQCLPGCREDATCPLNMICLLNVACTTCPCAPGWCQLDPCRDVDGDGFVPSSQTTLTCPGKQLGDCNDGNARVHPGAIEVCANYMDDNCDGKTDTADSASCQTCTQGHNRCSNSAQCSFGSTFCEQGCCQSCPPVAQVTCAADQCALPGGYDAQTGCPQSEVCGACLSCGTEVKPVCGDNFATYQNACLAQAAGATVLHAGACQTYEGRRCDGYAVGSRGNCVSGQYCRDACPDCEASQLVCTRVGTCVVDADCPAGITGTALCPDSSIAPLACSDGVCVVKCLQTP
jgi:hypothetical protein